MLTEESAAKSTKIAELNLEVKQLNVDNASLVNKIKVMEEQIKVHQNQLHQTNINAQKARDMATSAEWESKSANLVMAQLKSENVTLRTEIEQLEKQLAQTTQLQNETVDHLE